MIDVVVEAEVVEVPEAAAEPDVNKNLLPAELKVIEESRPLVECAPLPEDGKVEVVLVLVEDVSRVWVVRKELEQKLDNGRSTSQTGVEVGSCSISRGRMCLRHQVLARPADV